MASEGIGGYIRTNSDSVGWFEVANGEMRSLNSIDPIVVVGVYIGTQVVKLLGL